MSDRTLREAGRLLASGVDPTLLLEGLPTEVRRRVARAALADLLRNAGVYTVIDAVVATLYRDSGAHPIGLGRGRRYHFDVPELPNGARWFARSVLEALLEPL